MHSYIATSTGNRFDFINPVQDDFYFDDLSLGLANICRFAGQTKQRHSVAQHSVLVSILCDMRGHPEAAMWGLLHDSPESVMGDTVTPLKVILGENFKRVEDRVEDFMTYKFRYELDFGPTPEVRAIVKQADFDVFMLEKDVLCHPDSMDQFQDFADPSKHPGGTIYDLDPNWYPQSSPIAQKYFENRFDELVERQRTKKRKDNV